MHSTNQPAYKIKINGGYPHESYPILHLGVSVGGRAHEKDQFEATLFWGLDQFERIVIDLYDSVQRHNWMFRKGLDESSAMAAALKLGDEWIARNERFFKNNPRIELRRMEDLKRSPAYPARLDHLIQLYDSSDVFRHLVDQGILSHWQRLAARDETMTEFRYPEFSIHSRTYLLEELTVMSLIAETENMIEAYPGGRLKVITSPERLKIEGLPQGLREYPYLEIDFLRVPQSDHKMAA